ncbi:HutD family protein [Paraburkholderia sp. C35]|uniref:HutD/Ves family protein n=1 Tax=Paraburkholderia sp. C35 TaxID=2126993 RepID=UPI000D69559D|nr:HutD family protein [Paraburkholderia sp. C35]
MIDTLLSERVPTRRHRTKGTLAQPSHASIRFFDCTSLAPEPWANGGGTTRTVAQQSTDDHALDWRVSIATLDGPAKFSVFSGLDRTLVLLDEGTVELHSQDGASVARPGQPVQFSGDLLMWASMSVRPVNVLNVMTRRGACHAAVSVATHSMRVSPASTHLLLCVAGEWRVGSSLLNSVSLQPMTGIWLEGRREEIDLHAVGLGARLVSIGIAAVER